VKESNLVKLIRKNIDLYSWLRIETTTLHGFPDLIGVSPQMDTVFVECKIAVGSRIRLTPHQVSMNIKLWKESGGCNYFIVLVQQAKIPHSEGVFLYEGRVAKDLAINGVNEPPIVNQWIGIRDQFRMVHGS
jgi:Holliday junction resolvase